MEQDQVVQAAERVANEIFEKSDRAFAQQQLLRFYAAGQHDGQGICLEAMRDEMARRREQTLADQWKL